MRLLICSDGTDPEDKPAKLGGLIAGPCHADTTLLGIIETPDEDQPLRFALNIEAALLRTYGVSPEVVVRAGEPIRQILNQTAENHYDIAVIGAHQFWWQRANSSRSNAFLFARAASGILKTRYDSPESLPPASVRRSHCFT